MLLSVLLFPSRHSLLIFPSLLCPFLSPSSNPLPAFYFSSQRNDGRVPECFSDHILIGDAVVGQGLAPHGVERVVQRLGSQFVGLEKKNGMELIILQD